LPEAKRFLSGVVNRVYGLGNEYILKIEGDSEFGPQHELLKPVPDLTAQLLAKGAKVPKILDFDSVDGKPYILMEKVRGNNLADDWMSFGDTKKEKLIAQLAEQLQIWHSISFDSYCIPIVAEKRYQNLRAAIEKPIVKEVRLLQKEKLPKELLVNVEVLEKYYHDHIASLDEIGTAVLTHSDIHLENIFYEGDRLTGIIDLDWVAQAPKDFELWKILDTFHDPLYTVEGRLESLYEGYQMTRELDWLKKYYPALFETKKLVERVKLYYLDPLLETIVDYQNGLWRKRAFSKVMDKVRDFYQNSWLDEVLKSH